MRRNRRSSSPGSAAKLACARDMTPFDVRDMIHSYM